ICGAAVVQNGQNSSIRCPSNGRVGEADRTEPIGRSTGRVSLDAVSRAQLDSRYAPQQGGRLAALTIDPAERGLRIPQHVLQVALWLSDSHEVEIALMNSWAILARPSTRTTCSLSKFELHVASG